MQLCFDRYFEQLFAQEAGREKEHFHVLYVVEQLSSRRRLGSMFERGSETSSAAQTPGQDWPRDAADEWIPAFACGGRDDNPYEGHDPATVKSSMRRVGESAPVRNSRSLAATSRANMSLRLPATVISLTGKAIAPFSIQKPAAPRL